MSRLLTSDGRLVIRDGRLVVVEEGERCVCCEDVEPEQWIRATPCACTTPGQVDAWMLGSDVLDLLAQGPCPVGRLPNGSCWEILRGAPTRDTRPPASDRLVPVGVGGCCFCCNSCGKISPTFQVRTGCPSITENSPGVACCEQFDAGVHSGYSMLRTYALVDGPCGAAHRLVDQETEFWWRRDRRGGITVRRDRIRNLDCSYRTEISTDDWRGLTCTADDWYTVPTGAIYAPNCLRLCAEEGSFDLVRDANGIRWRVFEKNRPSTSGAVCDLWRSGWGVMTRTNGVGSCRSRCVPTTLGRFIPPSPIPLDGFLGMGDPKTPSPRDLPPRNLITLTSGLGGLRAGCGGCGADDDDAI